MRVSRSLPPTLYWIGDPNADWGDTHVFNYKARRHWSFTRWETAQRMVARALPLAALLAALVLWREWRVLFPVHVLLVYCTLLHALTHAEARLSEPLHPLLLVLLGGALARLPAPRLPNWGILRHAHLSS